MSTVDISTIMISIVSSSIFTVLLTTFIFDPIKEKKKYLFDEKKRVYDSIATFTQIILYPKEARYSLGVSRYNIQELSDEENFNRVLITLQKDLHNWRK